MPLLPSALPPKGEARRYVANDFLNLIALPAWERGDRAAVDRVLSFILDLRRISSLFFIPLVPYPARSARHLPHAGKALSVDIVFPHMRVFVLTMREKRYSRFAAFPIGEGVVSRKAVSSFRCLPHWGRGTAPAVDRVLSFILDLRRSPSLFFIPPVPYPARFARHLPHAGKALCREKRYPRFAAFPITMKTSRD